MGIPMYINLFVYVYNISIYIYIYIPAIVYVNIRFFIISRKCVLLYICTYTKLAGRNECLHRITVVL
jgi:hypothetical protein